MDGKEFTRKEGSKSGGCGGLRREMWMGRNLQGKMDVEEFAGKEGSKKCGWGGIHRETGIKIIRTKKEFVRERGIKIKGMGKNSQGKRDQIQVNGEEFAGKEASKSGREEFTGIENQNQVDEGKGIQPLRAKILFYLWVCQSSKIRFNI